MLYFLKPRFIIRFEYSKVIKEKISRDLDFKVIEVEILVVPIPKSLDLYTLEISSVFTESQTIPLYLVRFCDWVIYSRAVNDIIEIKL